MAADLLIRFLKRLFGMDKGDWHEVVEDRFVDSIQTWLVNHDPAAEPALRARVREYNDTVKPLEKSYESEVLWWGWGSE